MEAQPQLALSTALAQAAPLNRLALERRLAALLAHQLAAVEAIADSNPQQLIPKTALEPLQKLLATYRSATRQADSLSSAYNTCTELLAYLELQQLELAQQAAPHLRNWLKQKEEASL